MFNFLFYQDVSATAEVFDKTDYFEFAKLLKLRSF